MTDSNDNMSQQPLDEAEISNDGKTEDKSGEEGFPVSPGVLIIENHE